MIHLISLKPEMFAFYYISSEHHSESYKPVAYVLCVAYPSDNV
jgi:hypothetical protein